MTTTLSPSPVLDALQFRHAAKLFDPERKINPADWATILEAGRLSPTSFGLEPYEIILLESDAARRRVAPDAWGANEFQTGQAGQIGTASHFGVLTAYTGDRMQADSPYLKDFLLTVKRFPEANADGYLSLVDKFQREEFDLTDDRKIADWSAKQAYIVLAGMMTAAASLGIDSCPIEGFDPAAVRTHLSELGVDMSYQVPAVLFSFGYRIEEPRHGRTRRSWEQVLTMV